MDDELKVLLTRLVTKVEDMSAVVLTTKADVARIDAKVEDMSAVLLATKADVEVVKADVARIDAKIDDVKHVTAANHFKVVGRIDQVASMLADHMADGHRPAAE